MKRRGILACLLLAVSLGSGLASGVSEFFIIAAITACLLLAAAIQAILQRPSFILDLGSGEVVRGQVKPITLIVKNSQPWPLFPVRMRVSLLKDYQTVEELLFQETALAPRAEKILHIQAVCPHRGEYQVLLHRYDREDIFGFFALPGINTMPQTLLSLPRLEVLPVIKQDMPTQDEEKNRDSRQGQPGQLTAESRLYLPGDTFRFIHWKKSVGRHQLYTRLREHNADYSCCLLADIMPYGEDETALDYEDVICEAALSFLFTQLSQGRAIMLLPGNLDLQSPGLLPKAAALLAALPFSGQAAPMALQALLSAPQLPDALFLLLAEQPQRLDPLLEQITARGCAVIYLCPTERADALEGYLPLISIDPVNGGDDWLED